MISLGQVDLPSFEAAAGREWLQTNGIGGFASGSVAGACTRRYHSYLVAALRPPFGRMALLAKVDETVTVLDSRFDLSTNRYPEGVVYPDGWRYVQSFTPWPVPTWTFRLPGETVLVKRVYLARGKNTVYVTYTLREAAGNATLTLTPLVTWKDYHGEMRPWQGFPARKGFEVGGFFVCATEDSPTLRLLARGARWSEAGWWHERVTHDRERERGLDFEESLYCPAVANLTLRLGQTVGLIATVEDGEPEDPTMALADIVAHQNALAEAAGPAGADGPGRALVLAADQFVVKTAQARTTILAGYPWFTDWGRDTMIALPGLCLTTGRPALAREILEGFAAHVSEGMIPNRFPDDGETPDYNTVDATLWFVHACDRYVAATQDAGFRERLLPVLEEIVRAHQAGTRYGIRVDEADGLLLAGEPDTQLTWMDAKIGDWVVTPRVGKPVEISALWINALRVLAAWKGGESGAAYAEQADRATASFGKFVRADGRGLYDLLHPDGMPDAAVRPNQVIAAALPYSPLTDEQIRGVVAVAISELLTPVGLRTIAPADPAYRPCYGGTPWERDSAYHQGTVWPWLLGPFLDAYRRVHGETDEVRRFLAPLEAHLRDYGVGGIAEVFDAEPPHRPGGCPWQAWSVAEVLRARGAADPAS